MFSQASFSIGLRRIRSHANFLNSPPDLALFKFTGYLNFVKTPAIYSKELNVIKPPEATLTSYTLRPH